MKSIGFTMTAGTQRATNSWKEVGNCLPEGGVEILLSVVPQFHCRHHLLAGEIGRSAHQAGVRKATPGLNEAQRLAPA